MKIIHHPIFLAGFRPFFSMAMLMGVVLPILWAFVFSGSIHLGEINILQWHAHEMFYGFGWAVLGGFLLTSSKNWVKVRGIHGSFLFILLIFWLMERFVIYFYPESTIGITVKFILLNSFVLSTSLYIIYTLIKFKSQDFYKDNYFFIIILLLFIISKYLLLSQNYYSQGVSMTLGLFRVAFVLMLERTMVQFMKVTLNIDLYSNKYFDLTIKLSALLAVFVVFMDKEISQLVLLFLANLLLIRWLLWKPQMGLKSFGNGIMYVGYLGLVLHLYIESFVIAGKLNLVGAISTHIFTFICMGLVIPAMLVRICNGHTGRKAQFNNYFISAIAFNIFAAIARLVLTQIWPDQYRNLIIISGIFWAICFSMLAIKLIPFLLAPRVDGKEH